MFIRNKQLSLVRTVIFGSLLIAPMSLTPVARAENPNYLAQRFQKTCVKPGPNGTCIPDKGKKSKSPTSGGSKVLNQGGNQVPKAGNPCKPSGTSKGCRDWINDGYKPKPRPKK